ncbi:hypothetical protein BGZ46_008293 [Entomortierella lignicola]|nr:hypothetical protein BGZ46_008293 [Entomortierella lignicola]
MQAPSHHDLSGQSGERSAGPQTNSSSSSSNKNKSSMNVDEDAGYSGTPYRPPHTSQSTNRQQQSRSAGSRSNQRNSLHGQPQGSSSEKGQSGMGDGIINQSMKEDLENWITLMDLAPDVPLNVVSYFGQLKDLSMFERIYPVSDLDRESDFDSDSMLVYRHDSYEMSESDPGLEESGHRSGWAMGVNDRRTTGDIYMYLDRSKNTLILQHAYLHDTKDMLSVCLESAETVTKDHTSPDMNIDPRIISVLLALSTVKRQIMQELDRFMAVCWERIGIEAPDPQRQNLEQSGGGNAGQSGRGGNSVASVFTPGKCVPVLIFVIERVPVMAPWHDSGANETQIVEQLKQQVLKKSIDALQTRLRYIFRASKLVQSIDPPSGVFDARQLFVLPSPSNMPFVHVIPYFTGQLDLPQRASVFNYSSDNGILDPAEEVLRQKMKFGSNSSNISGTSRKHGYKTNTKSPLSRNHRERKRSARPSPSENQSTTLNSSTLRQIYDAVVKVKDQPLDRGSVGNSKGDDVAMEDDMSSTLSLGSLYLDYTGPLLRQFVDGWVKNVASPGGYGSVVGKRNAGNVELPSLQQWLVGCLGVCEGLGINSITSPYQHLKTTLDDTSAAFKDQGLSTDDHAIINKLSKMSIGGSSGGGEGGGNSGGGNNRRFGNGRSSNQVIPVLGTPTMTRKNTILDQNADLNHFDWSEPVPSPAEGYS